MSRRRGIMSEGRRMSLPELGVYDTVSRRMGLGFIQRLWQYGQIAIEKASKNSANIPE